MRDTRRRKSVGEKTITTIVNPSRCSRCCQLAFLWNVASSDGENTTLHFKPNPAYHAPDIESRVFAVSEGDMIVNNEEHRIVSIKGRMMRGVKFVGGLFGGLDPGGPSTWSGGRPGRTNGRLRRPTSTFTVTCCSSRPSRSRKTTRRRSSGNYRECFFSGSREGTHEAAPIEAP